MRAASVVVRNPLSQDPAQMSFAQRDHIIQALTPNRSYQSFTMRIRFWCLHRRTQYHQSKYLEFFIQFCREDRVAILG